MPRPNRNKKPRTPTVHQTETLARIGKKLVSGWIMDRCTTVVRRVFSFLFFISSEQLHFYLSCGPEISFFSYTEKWKYFWTILRKYIQEQLHFYYLHGCSSVAKKTQLNSVITWLLLSWVNTREYTNMQQIKQTVEEDEHEIRTMNTILHK